MKRLAAVASEAMEEARTRSCFRSANSSEYLQCDADQHTHVYHMSFKCVENTQAHEYTEVNICVHF